jgi:WD40 repeat protein
MTLHGHSYRTTIVVFSPDKNYLVSGSDDDTLRLWDLKTGVPIALLTFSPPLISGVEFSSDGGSIIINDQSQLRFWALPPTAAACTMLSASAGKTRESTEVVKQTLRNQWLMAETQSGCRRICWVPLDSRGLHQLSHGPTVIIGGDRGRITIVDCSAFR